VNYVSHFDYKVITGINEAGMLSTTQLYLIVIWEQLQKLFFADFNWKLPV
jgi:hypothetical protein